MFKQILIVAFCIAVIAECKPSHDSREDHHRVARSPQNMQNAMKLGGEMANQGMQAATKGMDILSTAAQNAMTAGTQIAANAAKSATSII